MKIGTITKTNEKGQIVIPKEIRDSLGIEKNVHLNIIQRGGGIYIYPIKEILTDDDSQSLFVKILEKTQGAWAGDDWPETEKRQRKIELAATGRNKAPW